MKEPIGILDEKIEESDLLEIAITNIRGDRSLEYKLTVTSENYGKINQAFSLEQEAGIGRCGYDYAIEVIQEGRKRKEILVCFNCKRLLHNSQAYYLDRAILEDIIRVCGFDRFDLKVFKFSSPIEGRNFWRSELKSNNIDLEKMTQPSWLKYDGRFVSALNEIDDQSPDDYLKGIFGNNKFELISLGFTYMVETTYGNYEKFEGQKMEWRAFDDVVLRVIYK